MAIKRTESIVVHISTGARSPTIKNHLQPILTPSSHIPTPNFYTQ